MLFNSSVFVFLFLPATLAIFFLLGRAGLRRPALGALLVGSLIFYSYWNPAHLPLVVGSVIFNYFIGQAVQHAAGMPRGKAWLTLGVCGNLALLAYFKYAGFLVQNFNAVAGTSFSVPAHVLPLGISFFTFTQIAYLVDTWKGATREFSAFDYSLFVVYFPHLIAGPIVHHRDLIPQLRRKEAARFDWEPFATGITVFVFGLCKKVLLADNAARFATPMFTAAAGGEALSMVAAWSGTLAYTLQIYFDFSGYSDMAIGLAKMIGIRFPVNFDSPYRATSIVDFWKRWHITLSTFLRDYLYIPLGGNRHGRARRYLNVFVTMLLGGLWHGAGWTFIAWGAWHGLLITLNHAWRDFVAKGKPSESGVVVRRLFTFLAVMIGWVFFRANSIDTAFRILRTMAGIGGTGLGASSVSLEGWLWLAGLLVLAWFFPNTQQITARFQPSLEKIEPLTRGWWARLAWEPDRKWSFACALLFLLAVLQLSKITEFLYFQF